MNELINQSALQEAKNNLSAATSISAIKEAESIRVAMASAKFYPRSITEVEDKITFLCKSRRLAESAEYAYKRGGQDIKGASIKLVEAVAQLYGNIESGVKEIQRFDGYSECNAFAWDLENNIKVTRDFTVPHYRDTREGKKKLTDDRDIRELIFNYGSRNVRACLERVMPRHLIEIGLEECRKTLNSDSSPLADRIKDCKSRFNENYGVKGEWLEKLIGEKSDNWTNLHLLQLAKHFTALNEGNCTVKDLEMNFVATVSGAQIKEIAGLIGTDNSKIDLLKDLGYSMSDIKRIPASNFEAVKAALTGGVEAHE